MVTQLVGRMVEYMVGTTFAALTGHDPVVCVVSILTASAWWALGSTQRRFALRQDESTTPVSTRPQRAGKRP